MIFFSTAHDTGHLTIEKAIPQNGLRTLPEAIKTQKYAAAGKEFSNFIAITACQSKTENYYCSMIWFPPDTNSYRTLWLPVVNGTSTDPHANETECSPAVLRRCQEGWDQARLDN